MSTKVQRADHKIYVYTILGSVTIDEMKAVINEGIKLATLLNETPYIQIIDLSKADRIPASISGFREIGALLTGNVTNIFIVNGPPAAQLIGQVVSKLIPVFKATRFFTDFETAMEAANNMIVNTGSSR